MLSDPAFWTSIFVSFLAAFPNPLHGNQVLDREWPEVPDLVTTAEEALEGIERRIVYSKDRPRVLRLSSYIAGGLAVCDSPPPRLAALIYEKCNWRSIFTECHPCDDDFFPFTFQLFRPRRRLPSSTWVSLQSLHLKAVMNEPDVGMEDCGYQRQEYRFEEALVMVMTAEAFPALRQVTLEMAGRNLQQWNLPWSQLTSLALQYFRNAFVDYLPILGKCRVPQELSLHIDLPRRTETLEPTRAFIGADRLVTLSRLRILILKADINSRPTSNATSSPLSFQSSFSLNSALWNITTQPTQMKV